MTAKNYDPENLRVTFTDPETGEEIEIKGWDFKKVVIPLACSGPGPVRIVMQLQRAEERGR